MLISEKIMEREFAGESIKDAYLRCCKWVSSNIIAINNSNHITYKIEKIDEGIWSNKVRLILYVTDDECEIKERHCDICKEVTQSFFMKQNKHMCESCKMEPYRKRMEDRLKSLKEGLKGKIL